MNPQLKTALEILRTVPETQRKKVGHLLDAIIVKKTGDEL